MTSSSPGATVRITSPPTASMAALSLATTQPPLTRPRVSGRNPCRSLAASSRPRSRISRVNAPRSPGSTADAAATRSPRARSTARLSAAASRCESLATSTGPGSAPFAEGGKPSRLPLCAMANLPRRSSTGWAFAAAGDPLVE